MSRKTLAQVALWGALVVGGYQDTASAQGWFGGGGSSCGCGAQQPMFMQPQYTQVAQPQFASINCAPVQPQYTQIPVTEMRECRQTVQRPVVETKYVEQPVTEYRPVTETRTAQIPTVAYQPVTEYQTRTRDCGQWVTNYQCRQQVSPCEYDPRGGFMGWMSRSTYSARMAFTPKMTTQRTWVPNVVAEQIPITRQVPVYGSREVNYQVTTMVPHQTTRSVAVNTVRMVAEEVVTRQPVTVMRTVPTDGAFASGYSPYRSAWNATPSPDPLSTARVPAGATTVPRRDATRPTIEREADTFDPNRTGRESNNAPSSVPARRSSLSEPTLDKFEDPLEIPHSHPHKPEPRAELLPENPTRTVDTEEFDPDSAVVATSDHAPSAVRVTQWVARRRPTYGPAKTNGTISVADTAANNSRSR